MLADLQSYYRERGISAESFRCPRFSACSSASPDRFTTAKEAFVSSGYEAHSLPRILFLSLDSGSASHHPGDKTLASVRRQEEVECRVGALPKHKHWYRTHELAYTLLRGFAPNLALEDVKRYFAHTNSAKCCQNNPQRGQANAVLFNNCRAFIPAEIEILAPDVLITQGSQAHRAVERVFPEGDLRSTFPDLPEEIKLLFIQGNPVLWIRTYHPRCPYSKQNRDHYPVYAKVVYEFIARYSIEILDRYVAVVTAQAREFEAKSGEPETVLIHWEEKQMPQTAKTNAPRKNLKRGETNFISISSHPPVPPNPIPTQAQCTGFEFMTMVQFCDIAETHNLSRHASYNAFGGDRGKFIVEPARMSRVPEGSNRRYVLVSAVVDFFKEKGIAW